MISEKAKESVRKSRFQVFNMMKKKDEKGVQRSQFGLIREEQLKMNLCGSKREGGIHRTREKGEGLGE